MKRLVILVEGDSELVFVNKFLNPFLVSKGLNISINAQKIITNNKLQQKGGNISYQYLKNDLTRIESQGNVVISTLLDFFRIPTDFPGHTLTDCDQIELAMHSDFHSNPNYLPYIQKYEFETLLFASIAGFKFLLDDNGKIDAIQKIINTYPNPEDINGGANTSPSNRLKNIFKYDKVNDSELICTEVSIETMCSRCPRFNNWINRLLSHNYN
ncbi:DUF4276 family protein [Sphingobacterium bovistauri]|uniref:DUF4276 family protein n=1 Tax=Sphingobacterium bovistauri TaxID=2781959 RepID=A0ABS7Z3N6_9SPHI|nr:DUF4276 family protein [Sphingobacterium bovistauri]MCA5004801.1 DUF4276 family protein [Sphingobacterium bovistauri]